MPGESGRRSTRRRDGTQAVDRAALLVSMVVAGRRAARRSPTCRRPAGSPKSTTSRMLAALERAGCSSATTTGGYVAGSLFWLYAARHDPWEELVRLARPTMERDRRGHPRDRAPAWSAATASSRSPRSTPGTCSAPATGPRSTCPPTARPRQGVPRLGRRSPCPPATLDAAHRGHARPTRRALRARRRRDPHARLGGHRRRARGRPHRRRRAGARARAATWSPRSASRVPPAGSRTGSTSSAGSLIDPRRASSSALLARTQDTDEGGRGMTTPDERSCRASTTRRWSATPRACSS